MAYKVILDPGHGGTDPGATYNGRQEKDDALGLAMSVGQLLKNAGIEVVYTRTTDIYDTPFEKATKANQTGGDLFVSIHRNSSPMPNMYDGVQTLVFNNQGLKSEVARNINENLATLGFADKGIVERPNLVVLKRTKMPAVLVEAGFINSDKDNYIYDTKYQEMAQAIADGIIDALNAQSEGDEGIESYNTNISKPNTYGENAYRSNSNSDDNVMSDNADSKNYGPNDNGSNNANSKDTRKLYRVQVGAFENLDNAVALERQLRMLGFDTFITNLY